MSTALLNTDLQAQSTFPDVFDDKPTPFARLVEVELRKSCDTQAGRWLLIAIGAVTTIVMGIVVAVTTIQDMPMEYGSFIATTTYSTSILLPVLGILLVTSEWGQRTAMVTFTLEPRRSRVIAAKLAAGVALAVVAALFAVVVGVVANLVYATIAGVDATWNFGLGMVAGFLTIQVLGMLTGFALATLLRSTPAAIVVYFLYGFVLPTLFAVGTEFISWFGDVAKWIDFASAQSVLDSTGGFGDAPAPENVTWVHLLVSGAIFLVLPLAIGLWRVLKAEVK